MTAKSASYIVGARLSDGQGLFTDEEHVGSYAGKRMTHTEAKAAVRILDADRPEGHEDVTYEIREV